MSKTPDRYRGPAQRGQVHAVQQDHRPAPVHCGGHPRRHPGPHLRRATGTAASSPLVDTGGIEPNTDNQILAFMREQAQIAIDNATVIIFVTDIKTGLTAADQEVANMLQRSKKPIVLAVNKMDSTGTVDPDFYEFYNLGLGDPIAVSAVHGHGTGDLLDACFQYLPPEDGRRRRRTTWSRWPSSASPTWASPASPTKFWASSGSSSATWRAPPGTPSTATLRTRPANITSSTPPACEKVQGGRQHREVQRPPGHHGHRAQRRVPHHDRRAPRASRSRTPRWRAWPTRPARPASSW